METSTVNKRFRELAAVLVEELEGELLPSGGGGLRNNHDLVLALRKTENLLEDICQACADTAEIALQSYSSTRSKRAMAELLG